MTENNEICRYSECDYEQIPNSSLRIPISTEKEMATASDGRTKTKQESFDLIKIA